MNTVLCGNTDLVHAADEVVALGGGTASAAHLNDGMAQGPMHGMYASIFRDPVKGDPLLT